MECGVKWCIFWIVLIIVAIIGPPTTLLFVFNDWEAQRCEIISISYSDDIGISYNVTFQNQTITCRDYGLTFETFQIRTHIYDEVRHQGGFNPVRKCYSNAFSGKLRCDVRWEKLFSDEMFKFGVRIVITTLIIFAFCIVCACCIGFIFLDAQHNRHL